MRRRRCDGGGHGHGRTGARVGGKKREMNVMTGAAVIGKTIGAAALKAMIPNLQVSAEDVDWVLSFEGEAPSQATLDNSRGQKREYSRAQGGIRFPRP